MTFAKLLSEDEDLMREARQETCDGVVSAVQAIWSATKHIVNMSEHEREEFFGHLIGDSIVDTVGLKGLGKAANVAKPVIKSTSTAIIERTAQAFKKPRIALYDNAIKKLSKPEPLVAIYDAKTNSWRVPDVASSSGIQKFTGSKVPQTYKPDTRMAPARIISGTYKMPPPPKFANPHSVRKRIAPASAQSFPAIAATSSAGSKQTVGKGNTPVASSSDAGQTTGTNQQPVASSSNVGASLDTTMQKTAGVQAPVIGKKNLVEVKGYAFSVPPQTAHLLIQAEPHLEAIRADILTIAKQYDLTRTGLGDFSTKYIKLTYEHVLAPEFGVQRGGNVQLKGFHHDMNGAIEQSSIITLVEKTEPDQFGCYAGRPVFNGQILDIKTFFPQSWSREKVISKIYEAYDNFKASGAIPTKNPRGTYKFTAHTNEGIKIEFDITKNGVVNTCYPVIEQIKKV